MSEFVFRTEELTDNQISELFVSSDYEQEVLEKLKAPSPVLLIGSRGMGKSFLFKVCEIQLLNDFEKNRILPVTITFRRASLVKTATPARFQYWMLSRICTELIRALKKLGKRIENNSIIKSLLGDEQLENSKIERIAKEFEDSWKTPDKEVSVDDIPCIDDFLNTIEDLCEENNIARVILFIDEAAHVFLPQQQREFFTLFRDLRSAYLKCNAAVYPGVTAYGETFEPIHDAVTINLIRNINDPQYVSNMKEMVLKQVKDSRISTNLSKYGENFTLLAYAASGNPRYLLNSVDLAGKMDSNAVNQVFREYYREKQWSEHTKLSERYPGYKAFIDWGRDFLETEVLSDLKKKNDSFLLNKNGKGTTFYFWTNKNTPHEVKEALRILEYSGLVFTDAPGIRATRSEVGTRYMVNIGCLLAQEATPTSVGLKIIRNSDIRRMSEYGANFSLYSSIQGAVLHNDVDALKEQFNKNIDLLDLTDWQKQKLHEMEINTIGELISASEERLKQAKYIADVRARRIKNAVVAAVFEYLLG